MFEFTVFALGLMIGCMVGIIVVAMCAAAKRGDGYGER